MSSQTKSILKEMSQSDLFQKVGEICATVTSVISAKDLLESSLSKTMELFGANRGSIYILNPNGKNLTLKIALGMAVAEQKRMVKRLGEGIVGQVAEIKKPVVVADIGEDDRFPNYRARGSYSTGSFICAPLLIKDELIGVINISDKKTGGRFDKNELQLLDFLSSQIALNYRRVQLYQKFKKVLRESKSLKNKLGKSSQEADDLKSEIIKKEKLATIGKLAGGIAHEFNNPLDGVLRYTNLSLNHVKDDDVLKGYLIEIKHGLNRMVNIVRSLLACSRSESPSLHKLEPNKVIDLAIESVQTDLFHKNIQIETKLGEDLPAVTDLGFERVIVNLIRNAIDAIDPLEVDGQIKISTDCVNGSLMVSVQDNGCGMKEGMAEKIFEPFFTTKDIEKGCGLGLTIVGEIVKNYDGQIEVDSNAQGGTTFKVYIPVTRDE